MAVKYFCDTCDCEVGIDRSTILMHDETGNQSFQVACTVCESRDDEYTKLVKEFRQKQDVAIKEYAAKLRIKIFPHLAPRLGSKLFEKKNHDSSI